jgi:ketosteroid isomerase-like protein
MTAEEQIRSAIDSFGLAYKSKDSDKLASIYSESLIKDRAGSASEGKQQTTQRIRQVFEDCDTDINVEVSEIYVSGDLAYVRGAFTVRLTPRSGQIPTTINRRYLEIWRNEAGFWRVTRTMDNEADQLP